jgi:hypothetical protein
LGPPRNQRAFIKRSEENPWTHALRAALAERDATGSMKPVDDFVRRFKAHMERLYPSRTDKNEGP